ncbi:hypothetical protein BCSAG_48520 [Bacillus cereus]
MKKEMKRDNILVHGHRGLWYVIDETSYYGKKFFLLEHQTYGEDAMHVAIDEEHNVVLEDIEGGINELNKHIRENVIKLYK